VLGCLPAHLPKEEVTVKKIPPRARNLGVVIVVCALASVSAVAATMFIRSPQQQAAEAAPPPPSVLTAVVEERELVETVVLRGALGSEYNASIPAPAPGAAGDPVVTESKIEVGAEVHSGTVVAEVAGRPVIALPGDFPMYRDLYPGMEGKDVTQLQEALISLGFILPTPNGVYGPATQRAVAVLYENRGYSPLENAAPPVPEDTDGAEDPPSTVPDTGGAEEGPIVVQGELAFLPSFPFVVDTLHARVGEMAEGPLMRVASGSLTATTAVSDTEQQLVSIGDPVTVYSEAHGVEVAAEVEAILAPDETEGGSEDPAQGEGEGEGQAQAEGHRLVITGDFEDQMAGADVRITIETDSSGNEVLAVPSSAIFSRHDGSTYVVTPGDEEIDVRTGTSAGGWVQIDADGIAIGDPVVVSAQ
jgi:peptidoglycan hydrolase-like protein with peptidoglycan-binding domain